MRWRAIAVIVAGVALSSCGDDAGPGMVAVFGDSLTVEAQSYLPALGEERGRDVGGSWYLGAAPCDWTEAVNERMQQDPAYVVFAFAGNKGNSCGVAFGGNALVDEYELALRPQIDAARRAGAQVILVGPPDMNITPYRETAPLLRDRLEQMADELSDVSYVDGRELLSPDGFTMTMPCLDSETEAQGCVDGRIEVRSIDGVHFDPPGEDGYSSGAYRWATTLLDPVDSAG